jgi:hypothetical protein
MWRKGIRVTLDKNGISMPHMSGGISDLALVGTALNVDTGSWSVGRLEGNTHYVFVSWPQRRERLWRAREAWRRIVKEREQAVKQPSA